MKWYVINDRYGRSDYESILYHTWAERQIVLPQILWDLRYRFSTLRIDIPIEVVKMRHQTMCRTPEEYEEFIKRVIALAPEHETEIRVLPPTSHIGHLMLTRIGPACPAIQTVTCGLIVCESLKKKLEDYAGLEFFRAYFKKVVPLTWELGQPVPQNALRIMHAGEPESYILRGKHSTQVAQEMGQFFELTLPQVRWHELEKLADGISTRTMTFESWVPSRDRSVKPKGKVKIAVENFDKYAWFQIEPVDKEIFGVYKIVREDVYNILRDSSQWTLVFHEVQLS